MDEIGVYMNAVASMEDLCFRYAARTLISRTWSLAQYEVKLYILATGDSLYAAWALQSIIIALIDSGFWPIEGNFSWKGTQKGYISVNHTQNATPSTSHGSNTIDIALHGAYVNETTGLISMPVAEGSTLQVRLRFEGVTMSPEQVFSSVLAVMVWGKEQGPETLCEGFDDDDFRMIPQKDLKTGQSRLKWGYVIKAARSLAAWMVEEGAYGEANLDIIRDGILVGQGRIRKAVSSTNIQ